MDAEKQQQEIVVQIAKKFKDINVNLPRLKKLVNAICTRFKLSKATISIAIINDAEIRRVSKQFLSDKKLRMHPKMYNSRPGKSNKRAIKCNSATDCLSFDLSDDMNSAKLFELVVNAEKAVKEASLRGHSSEAELALYVTHGLLHQLGFDDSTPDQAKKMHDTEDKILQQFGYGLVYNSLVNGT